MNSDQLKTVLVKMIQNPAGLKLMKPFIKCDRLKRLNLVMNISVGWTETS